MVKKIGQHDNHSVLAGISHDLPALSYAQKLQDRAATVGFDWPHIRFVLEKLQEEIKEFEESYYQNNLEEAKEELGDILFASVNLARHLQSDVEAIMRFANKKFIKRFQDMEEKVTHSGKTWQDFSLEDLETFWQEVKAYPT